jgi:hypothetical protein
LPYRRGDRKQLEQRHHDPPDVASADPLPELTEPELAPELLESELEDDEPLSVVVPSVAVVPDEVSVVVSSLACDAAAAPIATVATTAATARPEVTATVVRRALSRWFIGSSCGR